MRDLYTNNYSWAERYVVENSGSEDEAKDIFQEAFIAVWRNIQLDRFHPKNANSLKHYLHQVVKNKWLDHLRSAKRRLTKPLYDDDKPEDTDFLHAEQQDQIDRIKTHFLQLGDVCREVLTRFYYNRESLRTISTTFNWTEATAKNNKYRCLQRLRELFQIQ